MSIFSKLKLGKISLKRKAGGTFGGDLLRDVVSNKTDGAFGNGAMLLQENETTKQADERIVKGLGAAAISFNETVKTSTGTGEKPLAAFKLGATLEKIKTLYPIIGGAILTIAVLFFAFKKKK